MMYRLLIRCSACFWTSSAMPCRRKMFRLVLGILRISGIADDPRSLKLLVVRSYRFVQHGSQSYHVTQDNIRRVLSFPVRNS